jgi:sugar phosphate isomerase/epimerase
MDITRRNFLKTSALAIAGMALSPVAVAAPKRVLSVQLYCVREDMRKDPMGTLKGLAGMGYRYVEHANYVNGKFYGMSPQDFKKALGDLGLQMPSGHTVLGMQHWDEAQKDFTDTWKQLVEDAAFMGQKFVVSPYMSEKTRKDYDELMKLMEIFNRCGELCQQQGMKFGYHNHEFEFSEQLNGQTLFDIIMKNTDADKVVIQLDMGNMYIANALARDILNQYPGRFDTIHVKDMLKNAEGGFESTILGKGLVGSRDVSKLSGKVGNTWLYVVEQEAYQGKTPMECMAANIEVMKKWGFKP